MGDSNGKLHVFENSAAGSTTSSAASSVYEEVRSRAASAVHSRAASTSRIGRPALKKSMSLQIDRKGGPLISTKQKLQRSPPPALRRRGSGSKTLDADDGERVTSTHYQPRTVISERIARERVASEPIPSSKI